MTTAPGRSVAGRIALTCGLALAGAAHANALQVLDASGAVLATVALPADGRWCLVWNHSVTGDEVRDCFAALDGRLLLERSHQIDFAAAGLGQIPGRGEVVPDPAGGQWIEHIDAPMPPGGLPLRVGGPRVDHRMIVGGTQVLSLSALAAERRVTLRLVDGE